MCGAVTKRNLRTDLAAIVRSEGAQSSLEIKGYQFCDFVGRTKTENCYLAVPIILRCSHLEVHLVYIVHILRAIVIVLKDIDGQGCKYESPV